MNYKKRKGILIGIVTLFCICLILTNSYAFWSITATQSGTNVVSSGCFDLDFIEGDAISLGSQFPISDADSESLSSYTFTITNTCNIYASYQVNLEVLPVQGTETKLNDQYVKVSLNNSNKKILTEHEEVSTTISGAITSYKLITGELAENESVSYDLREWLEENTPISQASTSFRSKIVVIAVPANEPCANCGTLMVSESLSGQTTKFLNSPSPVLRNNIESIVFIDHKTVPGTALGSWDVSATQDNSVIAWYEDMDSDSKYEVTIGSIGGVKGNANTNSLFYNIRNLDNIDLTHFYTHEVTNMSWMFAYTGYSSTVFTLDLKDKFDTSNVTNMYSMFLYTGHDSTVFTLDLGDNFDTSNVTNMEDMFSNVGYSNPNFTLDLGDKFDTKKVTNMSYMFQSIGYSSTIFTLDLGDKFDTSKVTNMLTMFHNTGYNSTSFTLDLGSKFDTSNATNMENMFSRTGYNSTVFTLDLGDKFDTSNVTNMESMFLDTGYSNPNFTLDLGDKFDTKKVTNMSYMFYRAGYNSTEFTLDLRNFNINAVTTASNNRFATGKTTHKLYASSSNIGFISDTNAGFTGTIINCTTSPASCPQ